MGCGNSKLNPEGEVEEGDGDGDGEVEAVPPRIRPLLRLRFLEFRKRRNEKNLKDGTLSKKELLKDSETDENSVRVDIKTMFSPDEGSTVYSTNVDNVIMNVDKKLDDASTTRIPLSNNESKDGDDFSKQNLPDHDEHKDNATSIKSQDGNKEDEDEKIDKNEKEGVKDDDEKEEEEDRNICPGSPSFRVYFVEAVENDKENIETTEAGKQDVSHAHNKSGSHESLESDLSGDQETKTIKKGKIGRSFKRVISRSRPVAVKNLLNVKSFYHLGCTGHGNDRASLLNRKTTD